ncbi:MAG: ATP-binding protein [Chloroflexota bacterium]|nr:ATP-binding protein [Chloroflexota bacterium]
MDETPNDEYGANDRRGSPLVVVGASAGGVGALSTLLASLPADFPAPVVIAQHIDPRRISHLEKVLGARSVLPVRTVEGLEALAPGVVYVIPADRDVEVTDHSVGLRDPQTRLPKPSVDRLMATAARVYAEDLIAVVLTGTGADGAAGARAVKALGGTVVVQNPETASYPGMPGAVPSSAVDIVAELEAIGPLLADLFGGAYAVPPPGEDGELRAFLDRVRERTGLDFAAYKRPTIVRRLQRRMAAVGTPTLPDYRRHLERHPEELQRLVASFLIKFTRFFRDPELFAYLRDHVLPEILNEARERGELRLWSAGCATGEEAYTLAMLTAELLGDELAALSVRIFATDIAADAVEYARHGVYPESAVADLPPEMVERHFQRLDGAYEVRRPIRGMVVFGEHDLGHRAPFPRIDLILCRNVLIYFTPELQRRALQLFAFALRRGGYLALGKAESVTSLPEFFALEQPRLKVFRRVGEAAQIPVDRVLDVAPLAAPTVRTPRRLPSGRRLDLPLAEQAPREPSAGQLATRLLDGIPLGLITTDRRYDIRTINGAARRLVNIHGAGIGEDLVHLVSPALAAPLRAALDAAFRGERTVALHRLEGDVLDGGGRDVRVTCYPAEEAGEGAPRPDLAVVAIEDVTDLVQRARAAGAERDRLRAALADQESRVNRAFAEVHELRSANQTMASLVAELRAEAEELLVANEESQAAAEEIETLNEELQATNEELETLNEELQATIEELTTTNDELQARSVELQELAIAHETERTSLAAVLAGIGDAVLVVGRSGRAILINDAYRRAFGTAPPQPEDESGAPLPEEAAPHRRASRGETFAMTFTALAPDGTRRWYEATGQPLDHVGAARGVVAIRDITDRSLRQMQDQWLGIASHELRTPLTALQGTLQLAARRHDDPERVRRYLGQAEKQARRLARLVEELVDTVRVQAGALVIAREPVDLGAVAANAVETAQALAQSQRIDLAVAEAPLVVEGDAVRLEQVLLNLLANAVTYAPNTERIEVRLGRRDGAAVVDVQDQGPGIPTGDQDRIFARYYRAERTDGANAGLGLGLFIAREIASAHGGSLEARSTPGLGTTFTLRLPLAQEGEAVQPGVPPPADAGAVDGR